MRDYIGERAGWLSELVRLAQAGGELDPALSPNALAHFCLLLAMGSALVPPSLHAVGDDEWAALLARLATALTPPGVTVRPAAQTPMAQTPMAQTPMAQTRTSQ